MRLAVLQLDTHFPRIPGDVACPETYTEPVEIIRIPKADVASIVTNDPTSIDPNPFIQAAQKSTADLIVTSCGFLAPFQDEIQANINARFIASSLIALPLLQAHFGTHAITVMTFDVNALGMSHYGQFTDGNVVPIVGLDPLMHLSQVIRQNSRSLNKTQAQQEVCSIPLPRATKAILLECTNLPPYKSELSKTKNLPIFDILDLIEQAQPGLVMPKFRGGPLPEPL